MASIVEQKNFDTFDVLNEVCGNFVHLMRNKSNLDSLLSRTITTVVKNLKLYLQPEYKDVLDVLPVHLKNRMLHLATVSSVFWKDVDLNVILSALCNKTTKHINLTTYRSNDDTLRIISVCENLKELYLSRVGGLDVTTKGLIELFRNLKNVQGIILTKCSQVNDDVIISISENCKRLCLLDIGSCYNVTDKSLEALSTLEYLEYLRIYKTQVSDKGLDKLISGPCGPKLKELRVDNCDNLDQKILIPLTKKCPNLEILTFHSDKSTPSGTVLPSDDIDMSHLKQVMYTITW